MACRPDPGEEIGGEAMTWGISGEHLNRGHMTEHDEDRLNLALRLISGRSVYLSIGDLVLLGYEFHPGHECVLARAEECIADFIKRALEK